MADEATPGATDDKKVTPPAEEGKKEGEGAKPPEGEQKPAEGSKPEDKAAGGLFDVEGTAPEGDDKKPEDKKDEKPLDPNDPNAWVLAEGVMGNGPKPEWFKADKYANVVEQAKAYGELEKRFGSFKGAPKEGKYEAPKMPEGVEGEFLVDHPVFLKFNEWAAKSQLSQEGYNEVMGLLAQYEAAQVPDIAAIKQTLGADADKRIGAVTGWAKANLSAEQFALYREVGSTAAAGQVLQLMEAVIAKARSTTTPPKVGDDVIAAAGGNELDRINAEHARRGAGGKLLYDTDPKHRKMVEDARIAYFNKLSAK
jgi:hypothetical protein